MRRMIGAFFMLAGTALLAGAMFLVLNNRQEDQTAQNFSQTIMPELHSEVLQAQQLRESLPTEPEAELVDYIPVEYLSPEDLIMTEKTINGYAYIGYLTIPDLNLELPVMSGWDSRRLQIAPCRFTGTIRGEDLVIMAHNYNSHFGRLEQLTVGSLLQFMDMDGKPWSFEVVAMDILPAEAVEEMTAGEYDLTLFTCTKNRTHRVTIRCNKTENS